MPTVHLLIKGKVQGVFFRATAHDIAAKLGLGGWVKNTEEGHVEATVSGTEQQLQEFIAWCRQGPPKAVVTGVLVEQRPDQEFAKFTVLR